MTSNGDFGSRIPLWIDGEATSSQPPRLFDVTGAAKEAKVVEAQSADVAAAVRAAESSMAAFRSWKDTSAVHRRDLLLRGASIMSEYKDKLIESQVQETSCAHGWAAFNVDTAVSSIKETASLLTSVNGEIPQNSDTGRLVLVFKEPLGPLLAIAPWNASVILSTRAMITPIAVGCTVVFKASEICPKTHHLLREIWTKAGLPKGVLNVIQTARADAAATTEALIAHQAIRKIEFIGSRAVGNKICEMAAKYTKPVLLELGGKGPAIVLEDADLKRAAHECLAGALAHHGQVCMSTERILVQASILESFKEHLKKAVNGFSDVGHAASLNFAKSANQKLEDAESKGATFLIGGPGMSLKSGGLKPTIVLGVTKDMDMFDEETFGPSASLYPFEDDEEAITIANQSTYGLNAAIHTKDLMKGIKMARRLEVGQVHINNMTVFDEGTIPIGGTKGSGWGRANGAWGLHEYLSLKTVTVPM